MPWMVVGVERRVPRRRRADGGAGRWRGGGLLSEWCGWLVANSGMGGVAPASGKKAAVRRSRAFLFHGTQMGLRGKADLAHGRNLSKGKLLTYQLKWGKRYIAK
jgi:hypothetical protein